METFLTNEVGHGAVLGFCVVGPTDVAVEIGGFAFEDREVVFCCVGGERMQRRWFLCVHLFLRRLEWGLGRVYDWGGIKVDFEEGKGGRRIYL